MSKKLFSLIVTCIVMSIVTVLYSKVITAGNNIDDLESDIPFNDVQMKHSHNSYQRDEYLYEQLDKYMIRSFELDLHIQKDSDLPNSELPTEDDWFLYHTSGDEESTKYVSKYPFLSEALAEFKKYDTVNPNHEVITVWIEMKDDFEGEYHSAEDLDAFIVKELGEENIYTPSDMIKRGDETTLKDTVKNYGWPELLELRGKFMFVILSTAETDNIKYTDSYNNNTSKMFLQALSNNPNAIFMNGGDTGYTKQNYEDGYVYRLTEVENLNELTEEQENSGYTAELVFTHAIDKGIQYIGTDKINFDTEKYVDGDKVESNPWSSTNNSVYWPFRSLKYNFLEITEDVNPNTDTLNWQSNYPDGYPYQSYWGRYYLNNSYDDTSEYFVDVDADGDIDMLYENVLSDNSRQFYCNKNISDFRFENSFETDKSELLWGEIDSEPAYDGNSEWIVDINNDEKTDYVYIPDGTEDIRVRLSNGNSFDEEVIWGNKSSGDIFYDGKSQWFIDINNDELLDYVYIKQDTDTFFVLLNNNGKGFQEEIIWGEKNPGGVSYDGLSQWFQDIDGDGYPDYIYNLEGSEVYKILINNGTSFELEKVWASRQSGGIGYSGRSQWFSDLDGDNLPDYVYNKDGTKEYYVILSKNTTNENYVATYWGSRKDGFGVGYNGFGEWFADIDGDGMSDNVYNKSGTRKYYVRYSNGENFSEEIILSERIGPSKAGKEWFVDMNSDGSADHISAISDTNEIWIRLSNIEN